MKCLLKSFFLLLALQLTGQESISVYDLNDDKAEYIFGRSIPVATGVLDQPRKIYLFDSIFVVVNEYGKSRIVLFDDQFNHLGSWFSPPVFKPVSLFYDHGKIFIVSNSTIKAFSLDELVRGELVEHPDIQPTLEIGFHDRIQPLEGGRFILNRYEPKVNKNRFVVLDAEFQEEYSFGKIPVNLIDTTLQGNFHLMSTFTINKERKEVIVGYRSANYLEKYSIATGELLMIAHEKNVQFPPAYNVKYAYAVADSPYSFFTRGKVYDEKLYILYNYGVPGLPKKQMRKCDCLFSMHNL